MIIDGGDQLDHHHGEHTLHPAAHVVGGGRLENRPAENHRDHVGDARQGEEGHRPPQVRAEPESGDGHAPGRHGGDDHQTVAGRREKVPDSRPPATAPIGIAAKSRPSANPSPQGA
ncbi:hypothetical protein SANTM175S_00255 [Streptomyces antimycoticus]